MDTTNRNTPDTVEEGFVDTFMSIYRLQFVMGSCRVYTQRPVTQPTLLQKCYTILLILLTLGTVFASIAIYIEMMPDESVTTLGISVMISIYTASFCNSIHVRFSNARQNVEFHAKMQNLDKLMKIENCKAMNAALKRTNMILTLMILSIFVLLGVIMCATRQFYSLCLLGLTLCFLIFLLELIVVSSIVVYFFLRVKFVNFMIDSYLKQVDKASKPVLEGTVVKCISFVARDTNNFFATSEVHDYLREIFSCFAMFQNLYRCQLLLFCIKLVVLSLLAFEMLLYTMSNNIYSPIQVAGLLVFMTVDSFIAVFLASRFGAFFAEVNETKRLSIGVLALHQEGRLRWKAKKMLKMVEETPPRFSIYEMWDMNAGLFVTILSLVTSLIVQLIQFAFL